ncbi:hypothetical protein [Niabella ginsengisoli]|uniref:Uncharacterized protein n=1 Tax=Niabella ginsengisoli TaxID=522298 RepID=A0ABS9SK69_9BACT|nr:hypothetical protein [Niabella ginsengisoli]MCH5598779.1 hypothetical protein [Niabella ginsengisoli]
MSEHHFPRGFDSWQKTHFEVVEALCYLRDLQEGKQSKNFSQMLDRSATPDMYNMAIELTDKFENANMERSGSTLFDLIEEFVYRETRPTN